MKNLNKCENCGGGLVYNPGSRVVVCEHCDSTYPIPAPKRNTKLLRKYTVDYVPEQDVIAQNQYLCKACGSTHIVEQGKVSTRCPSCSSTDLTHTNISAIIPDGIIPFELSKPQATQIFEKWLKKRKFAPDDLIKLAKNGKVRRAYVPVYNLNGTSLCSYSGTVKKVHVDDNSGTVFSTMHTVQDISTSEISDYSICANNVVDAQLLKEITKVDQSKIVPFSSHYLFGFTGIETNISVHDAVNNLTDVYQQKNEKSVRNKLKDKYDEIVHLSCNTSIKGLTFNHTYVPVFMNHYTYNGKKYHCYINGVTGKAAGKAPKSVGKILLAIGAGVLAIAGLALLLIKIL